MAQENSEGRDKFSFPPWLPMVPALVLTVMVALVAVSNARNLKSASQWRRHSTQIIVAGQAFENNLLELQRGMLGYVTLGDTNALASYYNGTALEPQNFKQLVALTTDNPEQEQRLKTLDTAMAALLSFDNRAIGVYRREGFSAVSRLDAGGASRAVFDHARNILGKYQVEEQRLWQDRDASEQNQYHYAGRLLETGSVLAAVLLLLATYQANRELTFRRRAEAKLKETLLLQNAILSSADYGIVSTNCEGVIQTFNPAAGKLLGYSVGEVIGKETPILWRDPLEMAERAENLSRKLGVPVRPTFEAIAKKVEADAIDEGEWTFIRKDGSRFSSLLVVTSLGDGPGDARGFLGIFRDISERKKNDLERERLIAELKKTLAHVKTLSGLIPICAWCKNVRSDTGYWQSVEQYVRTHSEASFSHGVCPSCAEKFKGQVLQANQPSDTILVSKT